MNYLTLPTSARLVVPFLDGSTAMAEEHPLLALSIVEGAYVPAGYVLAFKPKSNAFAAITIEGEEGLHAVPKHELTFSDREEYLLWAKAMMLAERDSDEEPQEGPEENEPGRVQSEPEAPVSDAYGLDAREYGKSDDESRSRRTKEEIAEDEHYLAMIEKTGKTIRAANARFKKFGSRMDVLIELGAIPKPVISPAPKTSTADYGDDEDLLG